MKKKNTLLIGKKIGMTQIYDESSELVAVTVIQVEKSMVTKVKIFETDGYGAVQFGFGKKMSSIRQKPSLVKTNRCLIIHL